MSEKIYCGSGRIFSTKYGDIPKLSLSRNDLDKMYQWMDENEKDWVNLEVLPKKNPEQGKPTHYVAINEWKPEKKEGTGNNVIRPPKPSAKEPVVLDPIDNDDDLPF